MESAVCLTDRAIGVPNGASEASSGWKAEPYLHERAARFPG